MHHPRDRVGRPFGAERARMELVGAVPGRFALPQASTAVITKALRAVRAIPLHKARMRRPRSSDLHTDQWDPGLRHSAQCLPFGDGRVAETGSAMAAFAQDHDLMQIPAAPLRHVPRLSSTPAACRY